MIEGVFSRIFKSLRRVGDSRINFRRHGNYSRPKKLEKLNNIAEMSKVKVQRIELQRQRKRIKKKSERYVPSIVTLQVLGSGARGAPRSLYLSTDHTKYLFNCGEGTQRLSYEHRSKLAKLEHIFLTTPTWKNFGGLPGIALTVQDSGVPSLTIHGPPGSCDIFKAVERFVVLKELTVGEADCDGTFVDPTMTVDYVLLKRATDDDNRENDDDETNENGKRRLNGESSTTETKREGRIVGSMAYICKLHPKPGTLSLEKCVDLGVPPGPLLGRLKAGENVTLPDGRLIQSSEVCTPMDPGPVFIVVECPDEDYIESLVDSRALAKHQTGEGNVTNCVVHFTDGPTMKDRRYREWMDKFPKSTRHMVINEENVCTGSEAIHRIQHKLHLLHPKIFPILDESGFVVAEDEDQEAKAKAKDLDDEADNNFNEIQRMKTLDAMHLRPAKGFDTSAELILRPRVYKKEAFEMDGFVEALADLEARTNSKSEESAEYPKVIMLGTGSCVPNKTRNTSGILLRIDPDRSVVLDCGEGTAGQLIRFYGRDKVDQVLSTIKAVYISHLHADHHLGLIGLLNERKRVTSEPVGLFAPEQIESWLRFYDEKFEAIASNYFLIPNRDINLLQRHLSVTVETQVARVLRSIAVKTVPVKHCPHAFGVSFTLEDGCKIVYSGDTMPCDALVDLGLDCDLLIHEATMEDELVDEAKMKCHSTISQAIEIGERMRAKFILLTHFSQRYSKIPHFPDRANGPDFAKVGIAYDNMEIRISQLNLLPMMYPALKLMFSEFCILLEEKAVKRQIRFERQLREIETSTTS